MAEKRVCLMFPDKDECLTSSRNDLRTHTIPPHPPTSCWRNYITCAKEEKMAERETVFLLVLHLSGSVYTELLLKVGAVSVCVCVCER